MRFLPRSAPPKPTPKLQSPTVKSMHAASRGTHTHTRTTKQAPPSRRPHAAAHAEARSHTRTHRAIAIQGNPPRWPEASVNTRSSHTCLQVYSGCPLTSRSLEMSKTATRPQPTTGALDPNPIRAHVLRKCTSMGSGQTASGEEACAYAQIRNFNHESP